MSKHPLTLWTEGFPNVALYNHLFKSCSYFILHIVFELFANVRIKSATLTAAWHYVIVKDGKTSSCGVVSTLS